jgi:hypothetical protein
MSSQTRFQPKIIYRVVIVLLIAVLLIGGFSAGQLRGAQAAPAVAPAGFVYRCGIHFCLDGNTFYFAGANTYDVFTFGGAYGDTETQFMDKAKIDAHFTNLQNDKVTVLRLWMFSHESWHGFEKSKGVYDEQEFSLFDYVIQSAKAHNIKLVPVFENYWEAYGGIDTRLSWEGLSGGQPARGQFFNKSKCPGCFTSYKNYVSYALNRVNHYSGIAYKNEPAIFAWELMNEPRYQDQTPNENSSGTTLRAWVDEMGAFIKGIDPNHMLGTGLEGHQAVYGFGGDEGNPFVYIHQSPYIDFTSAHPYTTEEWANMTLDQTLTLIRAWISDSHNVVGKPFFMGEFNTKNVDRSTWWTSMYNMLETADGDGSAFWWYMTSQVDPNYGVLQGAPELAVFRAHSARMAAKNGPPGPTFTPLPPSKTPTRTPTATTGVILTPTRTNTTGPTPTRTPSPGASRTPTPGGIITNTPTRTPTAGGPTNTASPTFSTSPTRTFTPLAPTFTPTAGGVCSPVTSTITAPFTYDGAGAFCWQSSNLGTYVNSWNTISVTINNVNVTNLYVAAGSYPAKINGYWYVSYNSTVSWGHFEAK